MKEEKPEIIYSDPVKEIMGNPPRRILRWGTTALFLIMLLFILIAWLIRYPDTIPGSVKITTTNPPVTMVSKITGHIQELKVADGDTVVNGELLAVMETTASLEEVSLIRQIVDTLSNPAYFSLKPVNRFTQLGEVQEYYASFLKASSDMSSFIRNDIYETKIRSLTEEINGMQAYLDKLRVKENLYVDNLGLQQTVFERSEDLYDSLVISASAHDLAMQELLDKKKQLQEVRLEVEAKSLEIAQKRHDIDDNRMRRKAEEDNLSSALEESFLNFKSQLGSWENTYLLKSPVEGIVTYTNIWKENQLVTAGEPVLNIIPLDPGEFIGRINLTMQRSGKVKSGQNVNIKLSGFPYLQYGMVRGRIKSISKVPAGDFYIIEVELPYGLTTIYGKDLTEYTQNMQGTGTAEIITDDVTLLQKVMNPFRYLIAKNRREKDTSGSPL